MLIKKFVDLKKIKDRLASIVHCLEMRSEMMVSLVLGMENNIFNNFTNFTIFVTKKRKKQLY